MAVNLATKAAQSAVTVALALFLTPDQLGLTSITVVVINLGQVLQSMGVYDVIARTRRPPVLFAGTVATMSVGVSCLVAVAIIATSGPIADALDADAGSLLRVAAVSLPFIAYGGVQRAFVQRELNFRSRLWPDAGSALMGASVTIVLAALGAGQWSVICGILVSSFSQPFLGLLTGIRIPLCWDPDAARETLRWSAAVGPGAALGLVILNMDYVVTTRILGTYDTGIYALAYRIAFLPYITVALPLAAVAFPVYSKLIRSGGRGSVGKVFVRFVHVVLVLAGGLYLVLALLSDRVVVLSPAWRHSGPVLAVLCLYGVLFSVELTCFVVLRAVGRTRIYVVGQLAHALVLLGTLVVLTRRLGIDGTAAAQLISVGVVLVGLLVTLVRVHLVQPRDLVHELARPAAAIAFSAAAGFGLRSMPWFDRLSSLVSAAVLGAALVFIYVCALLAVDRDILRQSLASLRG
jgi:PST family polysaccharide transporter